MRGRLGGLPLRSLPNVRRPVADHGPQVAQHRAAVHRWCHTTMPAGKVNRDRKDAQRFFVGERVGRLSRSGPAIQHRGRTGPCRPPFPAIAMDWFMPGRHRPLSGTATHEEGCPPECTAATWGELHRREDWYKVAAAGAVQPRLLSLSNPCKRNAAHDVLLACYALCVWSHGESADRSMFSRMSFDRRFVDGGGIVPECRRAIAR